MSSAIDITVEYVKLLAQRLNGCEPNCVALVMLLELSVPVNYDGFEFLKSAILLQYEDPMRDLANDIYPEIARVCGKGVSSEMVEVSIRAAIRVAWKRSSKEVWQKYFPTISPREVRPPTNAVVIANLGRIIELWQGCASAYIRQMDREEVSCGRK